MKRKLFMGLAFAALAVGGCLIAGNYNAGYDLTPEQIANLDALTAGESSPLLGVQIQCQNSSIMRCAARCWSCSTIHYRSSGQPGKCVGVRGTCSCGMRNLHPL